MYELYDDHDSESRGFYETLDEARGAARFDRLEQYSIWTGNVQVEYVDNRQPGEGGDAPGFEGGFAWNH